jgi:hypothetical protein
MNAVVLSKSQCADEKECKQSAVQQFLRARASKSEKADP